MALTEEDRAPGGFIRIDQIPWPEQEILTGWRVPDATKPSLVASKLNGIGGKGKFEAVDFPRNPPQSPFVKEG